MVAQKEVSMTTGQAASNFLADNLTWSADWAWGLPLIVLTVLIHVFGLVLINQRAAHVSSRTIQRHHPTGVFVVVMGCTTLAVSILHGLEACIWAVAYRILGALPDIQSSVLYSLNAITSYGHIELRLQGRWHLMGALEALNGWLLFGLTTAFLFAMIQKVLLDKSLQHG
jgi:hypothetical protein